MQVLSVSLGAEVSNSGHATGERADGEFYKNEAASTTGWLDPNTTPGDTTRLAVRLPEHQRSRPRGHLL